MERIVEQGILYDFYGPLLTEHQQEVYEAFVYDNLSLGEIASIHNISRQGVHDLIKRCDKLLSDYESKLHLVSRFLDNRDRLVTMKNMVGEYDSLSLKDRELITGQIDKIIEDL